MQIISSRHFRILEILYTKWPLGVTGGEIIDHVHNNNDSTFDMDKLTEYMTQLESIGQIKELTDLPGITTDADLFYLTPNMFMAISENSKNPNSKFSKKS